MEVTRLGESRDKTKFQPASHVQGVPVRSRVVV